MANKALDFIVKPGEFILEWLEEQGISQAELARRLGYSPKHVTKLVQGAPLTLDSAERLEHVTRIPRGHWLRLETQYRDSMARLAITQDPEVVRAFAKSLPLAELRKLRAIESTMSRPGDLMMELLTFFGCGSEAALARRLATPSGVALRAASKSTWPATLAWIQLVELEASEVELDVEFERDALRDLIPDLRQLSVDLPDDFATQLVTSLAAVGVRLVFVPHIRGSGTYGMSRLFDGAPLIALSLHRKSEDQFWFSLFHEIGHLLLHDVTVSEYVAGDLTVQKHASVEHEANEFAVEVLIPGDRAHELDSLRSKAQVREFAAEIGIAPGVVMARLQREGRGPWTYRTGHDLIRKLAFG